MSKQSDDDTWCKIEDEEVQSDSSKSERGLLIKSESRSDSEEGSESESECRSESEGKSEDESESESIGYRRYPKRRSRQIKRSGTEKESKRRRDATSSDSGVSDEENNGKKKQRKRAWQPRKRVRSKGTGDNSKSVERWNAMVEKLQLYHFEHGTFTVSRAHDPKLAQWVFRVKGAYAEKLREVEAEIGSRIKMDSDMESDLESDAESCGQGVDGYTTDGTDSTLSHQRPASHCRASYGSSAFLTDERIQQLNKMGFNWERQSNEKKEKLWNTFYDQLSQYHQQFGTCLVCENTDPDLALWVKKQRQQLKNPRKRMTPLRRERIEKLDKLDFEWKLRTRPLTFEHRFNELKQFREMYGHCCVTRHHKAIPGLGRWVAGLRRRYVLFRAGKETSLTQQKVNQLNALGFSWSIRGSQVSWQDRYEELKRFREEFGDTSVQRKFNANMKLGCWVATQRRSYWQMQKGEKSNMTIERVQKLNAIGFKWVEEQPRGHWEKKFFELRQFKAEFGDCLVPNPFKKNQRLRKWVDEQREEYAKKQSGEASDLSDYKQNRLERIGFSWVDRPSWMDRYQALIAFKGEHGHSNVPEEYPQNQLLADWVAEQRVQYQHRKDGQPSTLNDMQVKRLTDINFQWKTSCTFVQFSKWDAMYEELKSYKRTHGHCQVPRHIREYAELGKWVHTQQQEYAIRKEGRLSILDDERIKLLNQIEFSWTKQGPTHKRAPRTPWDANLEALRQFKEEFGHTNVPRSYKKVLRLGVWVSAQRTNYHRMKAGKPTTMTEDNAAKLDALGFSWSVRAPQVSWDDRFEELRQYKETYGDCQVPSRFNANPRLGSWVCAQRHQYMLSKRGHKSHLNEERIRKLEDIGFKWEDEDGQPMSQFEEKLFELRQYKAEFGDCEVSENFSRNPGLGKWVTNMRNEYRTFLEGKSSSMTEERMGILNNLGFSWQMDVRHGPTKETPHPLPLDNNQGMGRAEDEHTKFVIPGLPNFVDLAHPNLPPIESQHLFIE